MTCADFNAVAAPLSEAEQALKEWGIAYEKQPDGTLVVPGDIDISRRGKKLTKLPDLSRVIVKGHFDCSWNQLTSLKGAPASVGGDFYCQGNQLTSLAGAPVLLDGDFRCDHNELTSLVGAPTVVGGNFYCDHNQLTSLVGAPTVVGGEFWCDNNQLTSLAGAPASVGKSFWCGENQLTSLAGSPSVGRNFGCGGNPLTSLEGAPKEFTMLHGDFGIFASWDAVPYELQYSPETRARMEEEARKREEDARISSYTLQEALVVPRPVTVIKRGRQS